MSRYHNDAGEPLMTHAQACVEAAIDEQSAAESYYDAFDDPRADYEPDPVCACVSCGGEFHTLDDVTECPTCGDQTCAGCECRDESGRWEFVCPSCPGASMPVDDNDLSSGPWPPNLKPKGG